jgi:hypothetical protein
VRVPQLFPAASTQTLYRFSWLEVEMKNRLVFLATLLILQTTVSFGQTASDVEAKYGKPTKAYSVGEFVWMTPDYSVDGQVCRMRLYPKRISADTNYVVKDLPFDDFKSVVDQLIPPAARGTKKEPFDAGWTTGGGSMWATFIYERVRITYSAGFRVDPEAWKNQKEFVFSPELSLPEAQSENTVKSDDDFLLYHTSRAEIVTVAWLDRKCS